MTQRVNCPVARRGVITREMLHLERSRESEGLISRGLALPSKNFAVKQTISGAKMHEKMVVLTATANHSCKSTSLDFFFGLRAQRAEDFFRQSVVTQISRVKSRVKCYIRARES